MLREAVGLAHPERLPHSDFQRSGKIFLHAPLLPLHGLGSGKALGWNLRARLTLHAP